MCVRVSGSGGKIRKEKTTEEMRLKVVIHVIGMDQDAIASPQGTHEKVPSKNK